MPVTTADFWKLVADSRLLTPEQCQKLSVDFEQAKPDADPNNAKRAAEWLVSRNALSRYQALVLLAGRSGPFYYGDYRVYDRLDQGALKGQFRAVHVPTGHPTMLRFLTGSAMKDPHEWMAAAARITHQTGVISPVVQRLYEAVDLQAFKFVASEDLRGETLEDVLAKSGKLPPQEACRIIRLAAYGVATLHQFGIPHGDIRPQNLFLETSGNVKLLVDPAQPVGTIDVTQVDPASPAAAKFDYLAPEFLQPQQMPNAATDLYALGCTFFQLLTGQPPFPGGTPAEKLTRHASERIQALEPYGVPPQLAQFIAYLMAKNPAARYQHAAQVAEQLAPFIDPARLQLQPTAPPPTLGTFEHWIRQKQAALVQAAMPVAVATPEPEPAISINVGGANATSGGKASVKPIGKRTARPRKRNVFATIASAVVMLLILAGLGIAGYQVLREDVVEDGDDVEIVQNDPNVQPPVDTPTEGSTDNKKTNNPPGDDKKAPAENPNAVAGPALEIKPDDGQLLWASPTSGAEISLDFVPPDARILMVARPAAILAQPEGENVLAALGPQFVQQREAFEKLAGVKLEEIEQLVVALHDNNGQVPVASYRVTLKDPLVESTLLSAWGNPAAQDAAGTPYFDNGTTGYLMAPSIPNTFVMGAPERIKETAEMKGAPPVMQREVNQLRRLSDADRHFTLIFSPKYLFGDGQALLSGPYDKVRGPLEWLIGDDVKATLLSLQFGDTMYAEARMVADVESRGTLAQELKGRLEQVPNAIEKYIIALNAPEYWRMVAFRYPGWIRFLHRQTRVGVEDDVAIMNAAVPGLAAHNLVFGGELALMSAPGAGATSVAGSGSGQPAVPKNIDELLKHKLTFEVPRNDMNLVMADLEKEVKGEFPSLPFEFAIKIIGDDLKIEGITRNQAIVNFKEEGKSLADILTGLVRKANPVTTVKDPSETDQKLIWLIGPDPDKPDRQVILITTRVAANAKKFKLPPVFMPK